MIMNNNKKINKSGGITIPSSLRRDFGIEAGDKVAVDVNPKNGDIILHRNEGSCMFCGSEEVILYKGRYLCRSCIAEMKKEAEKA
ncbi:AbrB/MazE/SpoVT family DNA-binding domain-containing protein [Pectinatus frisingensis]|uniref:AbrB/MazE/SpoVT family DNA-binding domain-containing protein n=1 Tax=Pectinatus frisingensis TaxID=865 RepID=UPI003D803D95